MKEKKYDFVLYFLCISLVLFSCVIGNSYRLIADIDINRPASSLNRLEDIEIPVVILDAGHGGEDPGAIGVDGTFEKDLNLIMVNKISEYLKLAGVDTVLTRQDDKLLYKPEENIKGQKKMYDLKNRYLIACEHERSVFVSIHMNKYSDGKYKGLQVYYSKNNKSGKDMALDVQKAVCEYLQKGNERQIKEGRNIYLLERLMCPAVLIECGFLSNEEDCRNLCDNEYTDKMAFLISYAILENIC